MPRNLAAEKERREERQKASGVTSADLVEEFKHLKLPAAAYLNPRTLKQHDAVADEFTRMLQTRTVSMGGIQLKSIDDFVKNGIAFPDRTIIMVLLHTRARAYVADREAKGRPKLIKHMTDYWSRFCAVWSRRTSHRVTKQNRALGKREALNVASQYGFTDKKIKPIVTVGTVTALQQTAWQCTFRATTRTRLNAVTYLSCSVSATSRPATFLKPSLSKVTEEDLSRPDINRDWLLARRRIKALIRGIEYGQAIFHVVRPPSGDGPNQIIGFYRSRWSKTSFNKGRVFVLLPGPTIASSPCLMILVLLCVDGHAPPSLLAALQDPSFLKGRDSRRLTWPRSSISEPVMKGDRNKPVTTNRMTVYIKKLSILSGFKTVLTAYFPRHLGAQALKRKGVTVADVRATLGHQPGSSATAHYESRAVPVSGMTALNGQAVMKSNSGLATDTLPNALAPVILTKEEEKEVQAQADEEIEARKITRPNVQYHIRQRLREKKLMDLRDKFFSAGPDGDRPSSTTAAGSRYMRPSDKEWYNALCLKPSDDLAPLVACITKYHVGQLKKSRKRKGKGGHSCRAKGTSEEDEEDEDWEDVDTDEDEDEVLKELLEDSDEDQEGQADSDSEDEHDQESDELLRAAVERKAENSEEPGNVDCFSDVSSLLDSDASSSDEDMPGEGEESDTDFQL